MEKGEDASKRPNEGTVGENKRLKASAATAESCCCTDDLHGFILPTVLNGAEALRNAYERSKPYHHASIPQVFHLDFIDKVIEEIQHNAKVNFKESDLFRVYQSMDMANLIESEHADSMPNVWKLREILYSRQWRSFIERVCGLPSGTLIDKVDCACNCHIEGCHLLCHDDVIGTRKVSYIIYMTEDDWTAAEGGALELYDRVLFTESSYDGTTEYVPTSIPSTVHLPMRNSMALFVVEPGVSFHAVQQVLGSRPRLSLQGWYHASKPPANIEHATLQRLKGSRDGVANKEMFHPYPSLAVKSLPTAASMEQSDIPLSSDDQEFLSKYVQSTYLQPDSIREIKTRFEAESSVQLRNFLKADWIEKLSCLMNKEDQEDEKLVTDPQYYQQGVKEKWILTGPSHKQRYLEYQYNQKEDGPVNNPATMGEYMTILRQELLQSQPFRRYLAVLTSLGEPLGYHGTTRRFRRGLDYTVAHHGLLMEQAVLDATLCFVAGKGKDVQTDMETENDAANIHEADVKWQSGDYGGFECYIAADDEDDDGVEAGPADEYNEDDDTELLSVSASNNTLNLVYRDEGTMRFVKYVGSKAPSSRWDLAMVYEVEQGEENHADECEDGSEH